ncbi:MAG: glycosyltransferase [Roseburia sp.]|nr:glycosyltransferase [Roseburia sp.]
MKELQIVLICDDSYRIPTYITVFSIKQNKCDGVCCRIHIIANTDAPEKYGIFLNMQTEDFKICLHCVSGEKVNELGKSDGESFCQATPSALLKFYIPDILPETDRVIYLDGDVIVRGDLTGLYETELGDAYIGAVRDSGCLYSGRKNVQENETYFNSGVMLLDLKKMKNLIPVLVEAKQRQTDRTLMDQDVFNEVLEGKVRLLPLRYNLLYTNLVRAREKYAMADVNRIFGTDYRFLQDAYRDAVILHFSSKDKPWKSTQSPMARVWYGCYRQAKAAFGKDAEKENPFAEFEELLPQDRGLLNAMGAGKDALMAEDRRVIASLTSYPARLPYAVRVIETVLAQAEVPDLIILWLTEEEIPGKEKELPKELLDLREHGLIIGWCRNLKPHNKYLFTLKEYPEDIIITVDDDIVYEPWVFQQLYRSYLLYPSAVSAMRVHVVGFDENGGVAKYTDWEQEIEHALLEPRYDLIATGVGGVLYPPHSLHEEAVNEDCAVKYCPTTDDLWLKIMSVKNGTKTVLAYPNVELHVLKESQTTALYRANRAGGENDAQFQAVLGQYNMLEDGKTITGLLLPEYREMTERLQKPVVSVILPVCNREAPFRKCIDSLLKQSLRNIEILVFDNGTKGRILAEYMGKDKRISIYTAKKTFGWLVNEGIDMARGEYVVIADCGTEYETYWLKNQYLRMKQNQADVGICKINYWDELSGTYRLNDWEKRYYKLPAASVFSFDGIREDRFNAFTYRMDDKLYRREFLRENGIRFDEMVTGYTDLRFIYGSLVAAERITFSDEIAGHLDIWQEVIESGLVSWELLYHSLTKLRMHLCEKKILPLYKRDFDNFALALMLREYRFCSMAEIEARYERLRENDFESYGFGQFEKSYFYNEQMYEEYRYICTFPFNRQIVKTALSHENREIKKQEEWKKQIKNLKSLREECGRLRAQNKQLGYAAYCLEEVRKSKSYKLGLAVTAIPRALRKTINVNNK